MSAKDLRSAIIIGLSVGSGPGIIDRVEGEIKDFIAHQIMIFSKNKPNDEKVLIEFFVHIFKNIPASKGEK